MAAAVGVPLVVLGFVLWVPQAGDQGSANSDLGSALIGGAVVGFAVLMLQWRFDVIAEERAGQAALAQSERDAAAAATRRRQDERHHAQILTALRQDLPGVDLTDRDLSGFYLRGRTLTRARFDRSVLAGADLGGADLRRAVMLGARVEPSVYMKHAALYGGVLDGARMEGADLRGADLRHTYLRRAKLRGSDLRGADLRSANFSDAEDLELSNLTDARYDEHTTWPDAFVPDDHGALEIDPTDAWEAPGAAAPIAS